jgi:hypothetical protein
MDQLSIDVEMFFSLADILLTALGIYTAWYFIYRVLP